MDRVGAPACRQKLDQPLDLPPPAEVEQVAELGAAVGARRGLACGQLAEPRDQLGRLGRRRPVGKMDIKGQGIPRESGVRRQATKAALPKRADPWSMRGKPETLALARDRSGCHGRIVNRPSNFQRAGGALLAAAILVGVVAGILLRQPSLGFLIGLAAGMLLLAGVWLRDRGRRS